MRSLKTMLIAGAAAGMMLGGSALASAQGNELPNDPRSCVRAMVGEMRTCVPQGPQIVDPGSKDSPKGEDVQRPEPCRPNIEILADYFNCYGGEVDGIDVPPVQVPLKRESNVKAATPSNK